MNPIPSANPSQLLPSNLLRGGQTSASQIFQQNPLQQGVSPSAMGADPSLMQQPQPGSAAGNPTMPPGGGQPMPGQPQAGQPASAMLGTDPQISEAQYILNALADRLKHHSRITEKTVSTLSDMIGSQLPSPDQGQQNAPTA